MEKKSVYRNSSLVVQSILVIFSLLLIGFTIYLTDHYFKTIFPTGISSGGICNLNSFFNCDVATYSPFSNIVGIPISIFGLIFSIFILAGTVFYSEEYEGTIKKFLYINATGCLILFLYSLIFLGGLCPFCTLYYIFSWATLFLFYKYSNATALSPKLIILMTVVILISAAITKNFVNKKESDKKSIATDLIKQYDNLPNLGNPDFESEFRLVSSSKKFTDAPIQITKFSDFECPACRMLSKVLHKLAPQYKGKINIQYFFYPLQVECNPAMKRPLHEYACKAAYLASCSPEKFSEIEETIFINQDKLSNHYLDELAKKYKLTKCMNDEATKTKVAKYLQAAGPFNIKSTPTFLLNGVKIEGVLPENQLQILLDHVLKKNESK